MGVGIKGPAARVTLCVPNATVKEVVKTVVPLVMMMMGGGGEPAAEPGDF
jgi:hypothetical protein